MGIRLWYVGEKGLVHQYCLQTIMDEVFVIAKLI